MLLPLAMLAAILLQAAPAAPAAKAPSEIVATAPERDWVAIASSDLLVMDLAPDRNGKARRVVIQLIPAPFSQGWVGNIRKLAAAHWWDGTTINRVQDNYVTQWGDPTEKKPLPPGLVTPPEADYVTALPERTRVVAGEAVAEPDLSRLFATFPHVLDSYGTLAMFDRGWPVVTTTTSSSMWPVHCYGMVGVGRNLSPDTGSGAELYTVIGHAPRHLDRNIALVGRVIEGIEHLSSLPRGTEALGFYKTAAERTPIVRVRLASELPAAERPRFEYLSTESATFAAYADARANRHDAFFNVPAGGADICNVPVPVRRAK